MENNDLNQILYQVNNKEKTLFRNIEKTLFKLNNCNNSIDFLNYCINNGLLPKYIQACSKVS